MKKRTFFIALAGAAGAARSVSGNFLNKEAERIPVIEPSFSGFLAATRVERNRLHQLDEPRPVAPSTLRAIDAEAKKFFSSQAAGGQRRAQYYLASVLDALYRASNGEHYRLQSVEWAAKAQAQGHPGASFLLIRKLPDTRDEDLTKQYMRAIRLGSVSALASCSGVESIVRIGKDWMKEGPLIPYPEFASVSQWSDVYFHWMIVYHFLIRWNGGFRLEMPNKDLIDIITGHLPPSDEYKEAFGTQVFRDLTNKAAAFAEKMDIDFRAEELFNQVWLKMFHNTN